MRRTMRTRRTSLRRKRNNTTGSVFGLDTDPMSPYRATGESDGGGSRRNAVDEEDEEDEEDNEDEEDEEDEDKEEEEDEEDSENE
jgi:hypothetical protein